MSTMDISTLSAGIDSSLAKVFESACDVAKSAPKHDVETGFEQESEPVEFTEEYVESAVDQINQVMEVMNKGLRFQIDETTEEMYIQVVNEDTGEVIRSTPPEALLEFRSRFEDWLGLIFDTEA